MAPSFSPAGTSETQKIAFNSGTLDFGNSRIVAIDNISLTVGFSLADLFILGSIKAAAKMRHSEKISLSATIKTYSPTLEALNAGTISSGTPNAIYVLDGQPSVANPVLTVFDSNGKEIQYQLNYFVFTSTKITTKAEDYAEWAIDGEAIDIVQLYN